MAADIGFGVVPSLTPDAVHAHDWRARSNEDFRIDIGVIEIVPPQASFGLTRGISIVAPGNRDWIRSHSAARTSISREAQLDFEVSLYRSNRRHFGRTKPNGYGRHLAALARNHSIALVQRLEKRRASSI